MKIIKCAMCRKAVLPPRKTHCSLECGRKYSTYLATFKERADIRAKRAAFQPEQRACPRCGVEVWTTFEVPHRKYCSRSCAKRSARTTNEKNRVARGDRAFLVQRRLSSRIREVLYRNHAIKSFATLKYLGCTSTQLREHLESQFVEGMTWESYGVTGWHVDHILPCAVFDLSREDHQMVCDNYKNLRPLWHHENNDKGGVVDYDTLLASDFHLLQRARSIGVKV